MHPAHFPGGAHDHRRCGIDLLRSLSRDQRIDLQVRCVFQRQRLALQRRFGPLQIMPRHVAGHDGSIAAQLARNLRHAASAEIQQPHRPAIPFGDVSSWCSSSHAGSVAHRAAGRIGSLSCHPGKRTAFVRDPVFAGLPADWVPDICSANSGMTGWVALTLSSTACGGGVREADGGGWCGASGPSLRQLASPSATSPVNGGG